MWVGGSWVGETWVMGHGLWVRHPPCIHVIYTYFYTVSNALSQQRFCPRSLSRVYTWGVLPYKGLMGTCGQPGYVFRDF